MTQLSFFEPAGFLYVPQFISSDDEALLVSYIEQLPLKEFEFRGYYGKRRVISFGWRYDFADASLNKTVEIPQYLEPLRARAAEFAGLFPEDLVHVLITEYKPGTTIGWHRDRPEFGGVVGVSLLSECTFRLRRKIGTKWERHSAKLAARSAYVLSGEVREQWEHSIPAVADLRYSITFRSLRDLVPGVAV